jgi:hypothetical protein
MSVLGHLVSFFVPGIGNVERRIGEDEVGLQIGMGVAKQRVGGRGAEVRLNAVDSDVFVL